MNESIIHRRNVKGGLASPLIKGGYSKSDYYKFYRKEGGKLPREVYARVLRKSNKALADLLIDGAYDYTLPHGMGRISFRKRKNKAYITKGKVKATTLVDWKATMELWEEKPLAKRNKILLRYSNLTTGRYSFRIKMLSRRFKNSEWFAFRFKRSFKRDFATRINTYNKPKIDALINLKG